MQSTSKCQTRHSRLPSMPHLCTFAHQHLLAPVDAHVPQVGKLVAYQTKTSPPAPSLCPVPFQQCIFPVAPRLLPLFIPAPYQHLLAPVDAHVPQVGELGACSRMVNQPPRHLSHKKGQRTIAGIVFQTATDRGLCPVATYRHTLAYATQRGPMHAWQSAIRAATSVMIGFSRIQRPASTFGHCGEPL